MTDTRTKHREEYYSDIIYEAREETAYLSRVKNALMLYAWISTFFIFGLIYSNVQLQEYSENYKEALTSDLRCKITSLEEYYYEN